MQFPVMIDLARYSVVVLLASGVKLKLKHMQFWWDLHEWMCQDMQSIVQSFHFAHKFEQNIYHVTRNNQFEVTLSGCCYTLMNALIEAAVISSYAMICHRSFAASFKTPWSGSTTASCISQLQILLKPLAFCYRISQRMVDMVDIDWLSPAIHTAVVAEASQDFRCWTGLGRTSPSTWVSCVYVTMQGYRRKRSGRLL